MKVLARLNASGHCNIKVAEIDKDDANDILSRNSKNRKIIRSNVDILRQSMDDGKWMFNGDSIVIDNDGNLKSGQHRLTAFVESTLSTVTVIIVQVVEGEDILVTLNRGKSLTTGQYLSIRGSKNANRVAAVARVLFHLINNEDYECTKRIPDYRIEETIEENIRLFEEFDMSSREIKAPIVATMMYACRINSSIESLVKRAFDMCSCLDTPKGSLAYAINKVNRFAGNGFSSTLEMIKKTMALIAFNAQTGRIPEKVYGIGKEDFKKAVGSYTKGLF